jgi:hypothetical protein
VIRGIFRIALDRLLRLEGFLEQIDSGVINALLVVGPTESVGEIRLISHSLAADLRQGKRDVDFAAVFQHQVGKIVRGQSIIRLALVRLLVQILGLFPLIACFEQAT